MTIQPQQFEIHPSSGVPIYRQVIEQVQALIAGKQLQAGEMLPSVREMAVALGVNPMTISKAYARMEADGVLERSRGRGMVVLEQRVETSVLQRQQELEIVLHSAVVRARQLGLSDRQILSVLNKLLQENPE